MGQRRRPPARPGRSARPERGAPLHDVRAEAGAEDDPRTLAQALVRQAVQALDVGDGREADRYVEALALHPALVARPTVVDRAVEELVEQLLGGLWQQGWQPADVARLVRRRLQDAHATLLAQALSAELRTYPSDTVDPAWAAQLDELGVTRGPHPTGAYLGHGGPMARLVRFGEAAALLHLLARLPRVERLVPPPGTPGAAARRTVDVDDRVLERIRRMLAKAESTDFPAEAETFTAAAQALMARHSIDAAVLAAAETGPADGPAGVRVGIDPPYEGPKASLLNAVALANRGQVVWSADLGFATVVGHPPDLQSIEGLFTSLLVQATRAMTVAGRDLPGGRSRSTAFRKAFLQGFAHRIGQRLADASRAEVDHAVTASRGANLLPVLASRDAAVRQAVQELFPRTTTKRSSTLVDGFGWASGQGAADVASLHQGAGSLDPVQT